MIKRPCSRVHGVYRGVEMKINGREILFIEIKTPSPQICGTKPTSRHEKHGEPQIDVEKYSSTACYGQAAWTLSCKRKCQLSHRDRKEGLWGNHTCLRITRWGRPLQITNRGKLQAFPLKSGMRHLSPVFSLLLNRVCRLLAKATQQDTEIKWTQAEKEEIKLSWFMYDGSQRGSKDSKGGEVHLWNTFGKVAEHKST